MVRPDEEGRGRAHRYHVPLQRAVRNVQHVAAPVADRGRGAGAPPRILAPPLVCQHHRGRTLPACRHRRTGGRRRQEGRPRRGEHERLLHRPGAKLARRHRKLGFRISLEGLPAANDELRGLQDGFDHGLRTLLQLRAMGIRDIGFGITLSDRNADDLLELYELADAMGVEFATAAVHNSFYFHKYDNVITEPERVGGNLEKLAYRLLQTRRPKDWFRAWFNMGLANYVRGNPRLLPCGAGNDLFFVDPFGEVKACNALDESMGSLKERPFAEIWASPEAAAVRSHAAACDKNCWMIGSASPAMKRELRVPATWVVRAKLSGSLPRV